MKRLAIHLVNLLIVGSIAAALPSTAVLEIRTAGNDSTCAGGFNSARGGTDYSQQNAAQATGTVTSATTTVTATTGIFTSVMVGNYITDGTIFREITAFTSSTVVTVDAAPSWTAATIYVGGALATPQKALTAMVAGNSLYVKADGTYSIGTGLTIAVGSTGVAMRIIGYTTTRGDLGKATIQASAGITMFTWNQNGWSLENIIFDGNSTGTNGILWSGGTTLVIDNCVVKRLTGYGITTGSGRAMITNTEVTTCGTTGGIVTTNSVGANIQRCYIHANTVPGVASVSSGVVSIDRCIISSNSGATVDGISFNSNDFLSVTNSVLYNNGRDGINSQASQPPIRATPIFNNIFMSNGRYGLNFSGLSPSPQSLPQVTTNAYYNNTTGLRNGVNAEPGAVTLTGSPFTNAGTGDFTLNNTASAGAACRAVGLPGAFTGLSVTGYLDLGALQHQDTGGGGGGGETTSVFSK